MIPPQLTAQLDHVQMVRSRLAFAEEMSPHNTILPAILVTDTFKRPHALFGNGNILYGNGNIDDRFSDKPANGRAAYVLDSKHVFADGRAQPSFLPGK